MIPIASAAGTKHTESAGQCWRPIGPGGGGTDSIPLTRGSKERIRTALGAVAPRIKRRPNPIEAPLTRGSVEFFQVRPLPLWKERPLVAKWP